MIIQLGLAAVLLCGVATLTGVVSWSKVVRYVPWAGRIMAPEPPIQAEGPSADKSVVESAFEAVPAPPIRPGSGSGGQGRRSSSSRGGACTNADSTRLKQLEREHGWDRSVLGLIACGQVRRGFTVEQLEASLGRPRNVVRRESGQEAWVYVGFSITVQNGVVVGLER